MIKIIYEDNKCYALSSFEDRNILKDLKFKWCILTKRWYTQNRYLVKKVLDKNVYTDIDKESLDFIGLENFNNSYATKTETELGLKKAYFPYQLAGIRYIKDKKVSILADEMGLGKTVQAIGLINYQKYSSILVICPSSLKYNWANELDTWLEHKVGFQVVEKAKDILDKKSFVISYDIFKGKLGEQLKKFDFDLVIIDEAHLLKTEKAKRTLSILGGTKNRKKYLGLTKYKQIVLLTGTLIPNSPIEMHHILYRLAPHIIEHRNYYQFASKFSAGHQSGWGYDASGCSNAEELKYILRSNILIRRLKKDVLTQLPSKTYQIIEVGKTKNNFRISDFKSADIEKFKASLSVGDLASFRKETSLEKLAECISFIRNKMEANKDKVVIFAHHKEVIDTLTFDLALYCPLVITGSTTAKKRQHNIDLFQTEPLYRIIIGNIQAMGTGFTLTNSSNVVFVEFSWVPGENEQCVDRCHRIGQNKNVFVQFLVYRGTIENNIIRAILKKQKNIDKILK